MASSLPGTPLTSPRRSNFTKSTSKPIIVIVSPFTPPQSPGSETDSLSSSPSSQPLLSFPPIRRSTYTSLLAKIARDAYLLTVTSLETLDETLTRHGPKIAGFIIASTAILHPFHNALALRLASLVHNNPNPPEDSSEHNPRIYTILFALSFPSDAISHPLLFASFMRNIFHLPWRLSGMTSQKVKTKLRAPVLRKLGQRVYRVRYCVRSVFLRNVKLADKVVVATGEFPIGGQRVLGGGDLDLDAVLLWMGEGREEMLLEGEGGAETESTDEEKEMEDWVSEASEGTAVGGDFGEDPFGGFDGYHGDAASADAPHPTVEGDGDEPMQIDEDAGFLADVEDNDADAEALDIHPIATPLVANSANNVNQLDDVFSDNSTFSPSLLTNSPDVVSTPATTTEASSFDEGDDDQAAAIGPAFEDEDEELTSTVSFTHTHAASNPALNLFHATQNALNANPSSNFHPITTQINAQNPFFIPTITSDSDEDLSPPIPSTPTGWVPSDDEGTSMDICWADSPIVIHEFKRRVVREDGGEELVPSGYVGFVGHVDDSRSMSTLILGMCAVPKVPE